MKLRDLKLRTKQRIGFGLILVILAAANIFSIHKMADIKAEIDEVSINWLPRATAISDINRNISDLRMNQLQHAFAQDEVMKQVQANNMITLIDKINENLDTYEALKKDSEERNLYSEEERTLYLEFDGKWETYQDLSFQFFMLSRDNENQQAIDLLNGRAQQVFNDFSKDLEKLVEVNKVDAFKAAQRAEITLRNTRSVTIILLTCTLLFSIFIAAVLVRYITQPVQQLEKAARRVADGDLSVQLEILSKDEIGGLSGSFNQMTKSLHEATEKLQQQADDLQAKNTDLENALQELRNTQDQLMMKEKMAALGDLVAGIAHEINNPIGTVTSSTDVSGRCVNKIEIALEQSKSLEDIKKSDQLPKALKILKDNIKVTLVAGDRIATIVKSLRKFAHLDESMYQRVDIHEGLDSTLTLLENEFRGRVNIIKEYADVPKIECYPGQLNQVFMNLFKNASLAIEKTGTIIIKTFIKDNYIFIRISDTGRGIPLERLDKIFDFGFSADGSRVKMGSGLATAYNIIQNHNGEIKVESEIDKGTTVTLSLPVK